jgi:hypothetical protein
MYAQWPEAILKHDKFAEERGADGELLFRGPRWVTRRKLSGSCMVAGW